MRNKFKKIDRMGWWIIACLMLVPILVGVGMLVPMLNLSNGSNDGWLGFWGGYLGSIIAIAGVWWQTNKTIKNEKELMFSQKRPYIVIQESIIQNAKVSDVYVKKNHVGYEDEPVIIIKNLSNNPMFSVKLVFQYDNKKEDIVIDRINGNSNIGIVIKSEIISEAIDKFEIIYPRGKKGRDKFVKKVDLANKIGIEEAFSENIEALKWFDETEISNKYIDVIEAATKPSFFGIDYGIIEVFSENYISNKFRNIVYKVPHKITATIYFTTAVREKIKLVFVKEDGKYRYQKNKTKLENKGEIIAEKEYDTSDMYESDKIDRVE
ncbi:hypothetical protein [Ligilactobacillus agilis]|uniref:hypothetical protein n=1 Tax=Ligilactobacillus agilis TaxID=1601 RepID=UPI00186615FA|nr:hypothetical protein [Ligilactobacillus agilis]